MPNGTSTTMDPVCWAAIGPSSPGRAVGMAADARVAGPAGLQHGQGQHREQGRLACVRSHSTAAPASSAAGTRPSSVNRLASRKVDSPGIRTNQVNGMITDSRTPCTTAASGT